MGLMYLMLVIVLLFRACFPLVELVLPWASTLTLSLCMAQALSKLLSLCG